MIKPLSFECRVVLVLTSTGRCGLSACPSLISAASFAAGVRAAGAMYGDASITTIICPEDLIHYRERGGSYVEIAEAMLERELPDLCARMIAELPS